MIHSLLELLDVVHLVMVDLLEELKRKENQILMHLNFNAMSDWMLKIYDNMLRNEFNFWNVHGIMNTSGLLQSGFKLTFQETRSIQK